MSESEPDSGFEAVHAGDAVEVSVIADDRVEAMLGDRSVERVTGLDPWMGAENLLGNLATGLREKGHHGGRQRKPSPAAAPLHR